MGNLKTSYYWPGFNMVVTSVSSAGIPSSYLPSVAAYHQLHSGQTSCQCCLFSTKLKYWSLLPVFWLCLALSVILCAMMQQNRTCTKDQATPTKCLIFTLLATVSKCHNSHSWSKHNCGINATPLPTPPAISLQLTWICRRPFQSLAGMCFGRRPGFPPWHNHQQ